jgi:hypothetical protein
MKKSHLCFFAFLVILLSACQSSLISDLAARPGERLFWEDFSNASGNWPQISGPTGDIGIANGTYQIQVLSAQLVILASPVHPFRDVQVEADAARLAGPLQNLLGLACRSNDSNNFYFFAISSDGYYALGKIKNGKVSLLGQEMMAYNAAIIQGDGLNRLRLDCIDGTLTGYVNSQVVATSEDADFTSGEVGLVAGAYDIPGVHVVFDNFVVFKP